jgi:hypothetical protein
MMWRLFLFGRANNLKLTSQIANIWKIEELCNNTMCVNCDFGMFN